MSSEFKRASSPDNKKTLVRDEILLFVYPPKRSQSTIEPSLLPGKCS